MDLPDNEKNEQTEVIPVLEQEKTELLAKVSQLEEEKNTLTSKTTQLESEIQSLTENNEKLSQECRDLQVSEITLNQRLESLENDIKLFAGLRFQIETALGCSHDHEQDIFDSILKYKQTIGNMSNEISSLNKELSEAKEEITKIRKYEEILSDIQNHSQNFNDLPLGNEDLGLILNDLIPKNELELMVPQGLNISGHEQDGWLIKGDLDVFSNELQIQSTFCMIGGSQSGKTFVLSKISGFPLRCGKNISTDCLKFKKVVIQGVNLLSIDTPGIHKPVKYTGVNFEIEELQDLFMSNLVTSLSNTIVFIVNNFNIHEQKLLFQFSRRAEYRKKKFIIVHNFKEVHDQEQLNETWKKQVVELYGEGFNNYLQYKEVTITMNNQLKAEKIPIFCPKSNVRHVSLVNNNSKFGKEYNLLSIEYIKNVLVYEMIAKKVKNFKFEMVKILQNLIGEEIEIEKINKQDDEVSELFKISFKNCISLEQIKFRNFNWLATDESSKRNVAMLLDKDEFKVNIDVPGISLENIFISCDNYFTTVTAKREIIQSRFVRNFSKAFKELSLRFAIPREFNHMEPRAQLINGSLVISYARQAENKVELPLLRKLEEPCEADLLIKKQKLSEVNHENSENSIDI